MAKLTNTDERISVSEQVRVIIETGDGRILYVPSDGGSIPRVGERITITHSDDFKQTRETVSYVEHFFKIKDGYSTHDIHIFSEEGKNKK